MRKLLYLLLAVSALCAVSCKKNGEGNGEFPESFSTMKDSDRLSYVMRKAEPDSVARFLCYASLGRIPGAKIDTLGTAYLYVIESYKGQDADKFGIAFEQVMKELPLADKMETQFRLGLADTLTIGYDLGLGYVSQIRDRRMGIKEIDADIASFREACRRDTATFRRFVQGFRTALSEDRGKDLKPEIYNKYIHLSER